VFKALGDRHAGVRRSAVRLTEKFLADRPAFGTILAKLGKDADAQVRLQVAYSLGAWRDPRAGLVLGALALEHADDRHLVAAVMSSVDKDNVGEIVFVVFGANSPPESLTQPLIATVTALDDSSALTQLLTRTITPDKERRFTPWQMSALAT